MPQIAPLVAGDPSRLGSFRLTGRIGEGGQGVVYLGINDAGERAAIKLLHVKFTGDATARSRFARELRAAQRVASFCTARVVEADLEGDTPYIASEFIEGRSLREIVDSDGPLRGSALDRLAIGTATALTAIHHASIVHRDFKPDNVLIAADGPRVVDFGIARILDSTGTITSRAIGTPAYMAPEQIAGDDVGPHTDVFAWGATIAFAATGITVFDGSSIAVVLNRILNHEVDLGMLPEPLRSVVRASLSKQATSRPSADQILLRLLGHPENAGADAAVLTQGVQVANPVVGDSDVTRLAQRLPGAGRTTEQQSIGHLPTHQSVSHQQPPQHHTGYPQHGWPQPAPTDLHSQRIDLPPQQPQPPSQQPLDVPPPSWQVPSQGPGQASTVASGSGRGPGKRAWIVLLVLVLVAAGGAGVAYASGWRPAFLGQARTSGGTNQASVDDPPVDPDATYASVVDKAAKTGRLTIGMRDFLPDVSLMSGSGTWSGFEVDLAKAIGKSLGVPEDKITFRATSRRERPALLATGQLDMVISTYSINTADDVSFAGPYYLAHVDLLVKDGSPITTVSGLEGRKLCQPASSVSVGIVQRAVQQVTLVPAQTYTDCMNMLIDGTVDAVPGDDIVLAGFANRETIRFKVIGAKLTDERYAVALKKGDQRGCEAVRAAIAGLYRDGTVSTLLRRHFGNVEFDWEENLPAMEPCGS